MLNVNGMPPQRRQWNDLLGKSLHVARKRDGKIRRISLEELLVADENGHCEEYASCHPHADLGMAQIQKAISFLQVACAPKNIEELRERVKNPMSREEFRKTAENYVGFFDLREHEEEETFLYKTRVNGEEKIEKIKKAPFMQGLFFNKKIEKATGIQKILPGFPDVNGSGGGAGCGCLYVEREAIKKMCPACVSAALYNKASCAPSFGGGFKSGLRGEAPLTVLVYNDDLRKMVWLNVLTRDNEVYRRQGPNNMPVWTHPYGADAASGGAASLEIGEMGLFRALFFQPNSLVVKYVDVDGTYICDCCGMEDDSGIYAASFEKQAAYYTASPAYWYSHPHSPFVVSSQKKNGEGETTITIKSASAKAYVPAWSIMGDLFPDEQPGSAAGISKMSAVVKQYIENKHNLVGRGGGVHLSIGGYDNKQSKINARRHETVSFSAGVSDDVLAEIRELKSVVGMALDVKKCVMDAVKEFKKVSKRSNEVTFKTATRRYYAASEAAVYKAMDAAIASIVDDTELDRKEIIESFERIGRNVLDSVTSVYVQSDFEAVAKGRKKYSDSVFRIRKNYGVVEETRKRATKLEGGNVR